MKEDTFNYLGYGIHKSKCGVGITYDEVTLKWDGKKFSSPGWRRINEPESFRNRVD